jgi:hypothetical protein
MRVILATLFLTTALPAVAQPPQPPAGPQPVMRRVQRAEIPPVTVVGDCATVPMELRAGLPTVEVMIGDHGPYRFAIDTGAQGHGRISAALAQTLGLPTVGEARTPAPGGTVATRPIFGVAELRLGGLRFRDLQLLAGAEIRGPAQGWDGILGIDLFRELILGIDYANNLAGARRGTLDRGAGASFDGPVPVVPIQVNGQTFNVTLDTGNGASPLFLTEAAARALPQSGPAVERGRARTSFGEFAIMEAPIAIPVTLGGTALSVAAVGWPAIRGDGNLGSRGLAGVLLEVDRRSGRIAASRPPARLACPG